MDNEKLEDLMRNIMAECFRHGSHRFSCEEKLGSLTAELEFRWKVKGEATAENKWIPVSERLPEERKSIFAKWKGTEYWKPGMFEKTSNYVIVTVKYQDGTLLTEIAHTTDGKWKTEHVVIKGEVIAWMPLPEPWKGE